jgi:hypothetical protein
MRVRRVRNRVAHDPSLYQFQVSNHGKDHLT